MGENEKPKPKTKADKFVEKLHGTDVKSALMTVMPKTMNYDRFMAMVISQSKLKFKEHSHLVPSSILICAYEGASLGLSFDPTRGEAHMVPYNCKIGMKDGKAVYGIIVQFQTGYRGLIKLCRNAGMKDIYARIVYEKDEWNYHEDEDGQHWHFKPAFGEDRGKPVLGFSIAILPDGTRTILPIDYTVIEKVKKSAKSKKGPWLTWREEMDLKTCLRRHCKILPQSTSLARATFLDEQMEELSTPSIEVPKNLTDIVDADFIELAENIKRDKLKEGESSKPEITEETKPGETAMKEEKTETEKPQTETKMTKEVFEQNIRTLGLRFGLNNDDDINTFLYNQSGGKHGKLVDLAEKEYTWVLDLFTFHAEEENEK